jgi:hypothetical protein
VAHWLSMKYEKQIAKLMKKYRKWQEVRQPARLCSPDASTRLLATHPTLTVAGALLPIWRSAAPGYPFIRPGI